MVTPNSTPRFSIHVINDTRHNSQSLANSTVHPPEQSKIPVSAVDSKSSWRSRTVCSGISN